MRKTVLVLVILLALVTLLRVSARTKQGPFPAATTVDVPPR